MDLPRNTTRGNMYKLNKFRANSDIRKHSFTSRVINIWNHLPDNVVSAKTVKSFENQLDKFWKNQDIRYQYKSEYSFN